MYRNINCDKCWKWQHMSKINTVCNQYYCYKLNISNINVLYTGMPYAIIVSDLEYSSPEV